MSNNPNKLAWKGTPGPWVFKDYMDSPVVITDNRKEFTIADFSPSIRLKAEEQIANAYVASAAPEAIDFIADLMEFFDFLELLKSDKINIEPWRTKGENILKKAYNF